MKALINKILKESEKNRSEVVDQCSKLIKIPTVNPPGMTDKACKYIKSYFNAFKVESKIFEQNPKKANICVRINGKKEGKIIWLGHLDVVPEGDLDLWRYNPFCGKIFEGRVYGRGASDMKGSCSSAMIAAKILSQIGEENYCTTEFWFTCDEETGGLDGAKWLSENKKIYGDICIIGDSSGDIKNNPAIDIGCKGYIQLRISAKGKAAHGSQPFMGENAINKIIKAKGVLEKIKEEKLDVPNILKEIIQSSIQILKKAGKFNIEQTKKIGKSFYFPSVSLNVIRGGVKINVVPDKAEALVDIRVTPSNNFEDLIGNINKIAGKLEVEGVDVEILDYHEGYFENPGSHEIRRLSRIVEKATNLTPKLKILSGFTDALRLKDNEDIVCLGLGVGISGMPHANNEYVTDDALVAGIKNYSLIPILFNAS